ncbi:hypothetical protein [Ruegeria sp. EL01]|jgi:hypothetical protein|uniref:hypothetical protein n=1 Tax=Ruegeria sp. EL01 TaxID=2107578 RepID=UPI000EA80B26|nr:hypothetical protein [Ruegeria sp. EL01]
MPRFGVPVEYKRIDTLRELDLLFLPNANREQEAAIFLTSKTQNDWSSYALDLTKSTFDEFVVEIENNAFAASVGQDYVVNIDNLGSGSNYWDGHFARFPPLVLGEGFRGVLIYDPYQQTHFGQRVIVDIESGSYLNPDHIEHLIYYTDWSITVGNQQVFQATNARTSDS